MIEKMLALEEDDENDKEDEDSDNDDEDEKDVTNLIWTCSNISSTLL